MHFTSLGWTPLHFNFFYSKKWSKEICAASEINYISRQWTHFALGPCWQSHLFLVVVFLSSTYVQFRHFPPGPWLHLGLSLFAYSYFLGPPRQFKHFPPGGWLHFDVILLNKIILTKLRKLQLHEITFCSVSAVLTQLL